MVVLLIPAGNVELVEHCRKLKLTNCLVKPIKPGELIGLIHDACHRTTNDVDPSATVDDTIARSLRILVVDDSPFNQQVAAGLLELQGHQVSLAGDGREAVELLLREQFDLIFMDIEMPELDGLSATRAIREWEQTTGSRTPIVGLSAHALVGFREQCLEAGMDTYITKPIQTEELYRALQLAQPCGTAPQPV
jgi:CheY-like chemotaxis protein